LGALGAEKEEGLRAVVGKGKGRGKGRGYNIRNARV